MRPLNSLNKIFRWFFFSHVTPSVDAAEKGSLSLEQLPPLHSWFDPAACPSNFEKLPLSGIWRFLFGTLRACGSVFYLMLAAALGVCLINLSIPILVRQFITFLQAAVEGQSITLGLVWTVGLIFASTAQATLAQHYYYIMLGQITRAVNGLNLAIFDHSLKLRRDARQRYPVGDVVNFMGTDSDAVGEFGFAVTDFAIATITIVAAGAMLFRLVGWSAVPALTLLAALAPATKWLGKSFVRIDDEILKYRDHRVSLMSQILSGIRIVKYFGWEKRLYSEISAIRANELNARRKLAITAGVSLLVYMCGAIFVATLTFAYHLHRGFSLDAATVFSCLAIFAILESPFGHMSEYIGAIAAAKASGERIVKYLREPRRDSLINQLDSGDTAVKFSNISLSPSPTQEATLTGINLEVAVGEAIAIVGPVGAGKTSLLLGALGEMHILTGQILRKEGPAETETSLGISYVPQEAFIRNATLRDNLLLTTDAKSSESHTALERILWATCLQSDLAIMGANLDTEIGEHGVNLSGGQKQRLCLARAACSKAEIVLLDDPVSAVDENTESLIIERLIFGMWSKKTRLMVTHRLAHLRRFDRIVFMKEGSIVATGNFEDLMAKCPSFQAFMAHAGKHEISQDTAAEIVANDKPSTPAAERFTDAEDQESGSVNKTLYSYYLRSLLGSTRDQAVQKRSWAIPAILAFVLMVVFAPLAQNVFLAHWLNEGTVIPGSPEARSHIMIYGALGLFVVGISLVWHFFVTFGAIRSGRKLHDDAFQATLATPVRFFDVTPVGRILNRFSRDIDSVERELIWSFDQTLRSGMHTLVSLFTLASILPILVVTSLPMLLGYLRLQKRYRRISRDAQRLTSITRSPRFAHFKESLSGLESIRAFDWTQQFKEQYTAILRRNQRAFHGLVTANRWFSIRIPVLGALVSAIVIASLFVSGLNHWILPGTAGMALIYAIRFWESANWSIRSFSVVEAKMISVERLSRFGTLPPEPSVRCGATPLPAQMSWPIGGSITYNRVWARYAEDLPPVLSDLSFSLPAGSTLGIIGRTGAGKSTIFQTLFRFIQPYVGTIAIDGIDIGTVPLERLRQAIAIIPQDPTLFKGTLRENLDRFTQFTDQAIYEALRKVHIDDLVRALPQGLAGTVIENGQNFSQGQRQLLCFARALLLDTPIIVLDEATASVDVETDQLIQRAIREAFKHKTLVIIAHRLETIQDCDFLMYLDRGRMVRWEDRNTHTPQREKLSHGNLRTLEFSRSLDQSSHSDLS